MIGNKWVRFDENKLNSVFSIMFTMLFHIFIMTFVDINSIHLLIMIDMSSMFDKDHEFMPIMTLTLSSKLENL